MTRERAVREALEIALGALADIGFSDDMNEAARRKKAARIYMELRAATPEPEAGGGHARTGSRGRCSSRRMSSM